MKIAQKSTKDISKNPLYLFENCISYTVTSGGEWDDGEIKKVHADCGQRRSREFRGVLRRGREKDWADEL
jgi:hypothetical protein